MIKEKWSYQQNYSNYKKIWYTLTFSENCKFKSDFNVVLIVSRCLKAGIDIQ